MPWATCLKDNESGCMVMLGQGQTPDSDDPRYGNEVHIVPVEVVEKEDGQYYSFGVHEFTYECFCHPEIQDQCHGRTLILHKEKLN